MHILRLLLLTILLVSFNCNAVEIIPEVIAKVNDEPITSQDVKDRFTLINLKQNFSEQELSEMYPYIIQQLIDETLMLQEGKKLGIKLDKDETAERTESVCENLNIDCSNLNSFLKSHNISRGHIEKQIKAQIIWSKTVMQNIKPKADISNKRMADLLSYSFPQDATYTYATISAPDFTKNQIALDRARQRLNGCMNVESVTNKLGNDFKHKIEYDKSYKDIPSYIKDTLVFLSTGYTSHVMKAKDGQIMILTLCNREFADNEDTDKHDEVLEKQMSVLVQNYLMSLRRKAVIDMKER